MEPRGRPLRPKARGFLYIVGPDGGEVGVMTLDSAGQEVTVAGVLKDIIRLTHQIVKGTGK